MEPVKKTSFWQVALWCVIPYVLMVVTSVISYVLGLGMLGVVFSQIVSIFLPSLIWSIRRQPQPFFQSLGLSTFRLRDVGAGCFLGLGVTLMLSLWVAPVFERWFPPSEQEKAVLLQLVTGNKAWWGLWVQILWIAILPGIFEELLFRRVLLQEIRSFLSARYQQVGFVTGLTLISVSLLFGLFHFSLARLLPTFCLGLAFTAIVLFTGSLWSSITMHVLNNAIILIVVRYGVDADIPVSYRSVLAKVAIVSVTIGVGFLGYIQYKKKEV